MTKYSGAENLKIMNLAINYNDYLSSLIFKYAKNIHSPKILDIGAGYGYFAKRISYKFPKIVLRSYFYYSKLKTRLRLNKASNQPLALSQSTLINSLMIVYTNMFFYRNLSNSNYQVEHVLNCFVGFLWEN